MAGRFDVPYRRISNLILTSYHRLCYGLTKFLQFASFPITDDWVRMGDSGMAGVRQSLDAQAKELEGRACIYRC